MIALPGSHRPLISHYLIIKLGTRIPVFLRIKKSLIFDQRQSDGQADHSIIRFSYQTFRESGDFTEKTKNVPSTVKLSLILVKLFIDAS